MSIKTPVLDPRNSEDIYDQALALARRYCPEMKIPETTGYFDPHDPGLIIFKLFSKMMEYSITQMNKIPDKHRLSFLDFVGIDLLPARPASVPVTFYLAEGSKGAYVPAGTRIASSKDPDVIFETSAPLSVVPAEYGGLFSLNSWDDGYTDHSNAISESGFTIFGKDEGELPLDHVLYIGDDTFFDIKRQATLTISIEGTGLSKEYFNRWYYGQDTPLDKPVITTSGMKLDATLNIQNLERSTLNGIDSFWLSVRPDKRILKGDVLPVISGIKAGLAVNGIIPDMVVSGNAPADVKKGFYPFGEDPGIGKVMYIGSEEAFSKIDSTITIKVEISYQESGPEPDAVIRWEYWNGSQWQELTPAKDSFSDGTASFKRNGDVVFKCPQIPQAQINGEKKRWIRVRIDSGGFGTAGKLVQTAIDDIMKLLPKPVIDNYQKEIKEAFEKNKITTGFQYQETNFNPPFVKSLNMSYSYQNYIPDAFIKLNNFKYETMRSGKEESPYRISDEKPGLYIGFKNNPANMPITLFFAVRELLYNEPVKTIKEPGSKDINEVKNFTWKYYDMGTWKEFGVQDETYSFTRGGIVSFIGPSGIKKHLEFGRDLYWIKIEIKSGNRLSCPGLTGIYPNTIWALNNITIRDEVLGSGTGQPSLSLSFSKKPVLAGQIIEVKEAGIPSKDELSLMESGNGGDNIKIMEESGVIKEVWVKWSEVKDFALSGPLGRHYVLDRTNGLIMFGDGIHGMVPPKEKNNVIARVYKSGGGKKGEVSPGMITSLKKTIPNIDKAVNHIRSSGGVDQETLEKAVKRGPFTIKNGDRAVTREDFEWLAKEASQYIAKARCVLEDGKIKIIIVPEYEMDIPLPEAGLLDLVETYIKERAYIAVLDRIEVVGPEYETIDLSIKVKPVSVGESNVVIDRIKERLRLFLHPLKGGQKGEGWDFGEDIFISRIAAATENIPGVDYVKDITPGKQISIKPNALPRAGNIEIIIEG